MEYKQQGPFLASCVRQLSGASTNTFTDSKEFGVSQFCCRNCLSDTVDAPDEHAVYFTPLSVESEECILSSNQRISHLFDELTEKLPSISVLDGYLRRSFTSLELKPTGSSLFMKRRARTQVETS